MERLIDPESKYTFLSSNNSALFLTLSKVKHEKISLEIYELNLSQLEFFYSYFYNFYQKYIHIKTLKNPIKIIV